MESIVLENIVFSYQNRLLFEKLDIGFEKKIITVLLGSSGCGKTTLLRLIAGLELPRAGKVFINGTLATYNNKLLIPPYERNIGFIFQDLALWPHMTVRDNILFGPKQRNIPDATGKTLEMLRLLQIEHLQDKYPHQLSGGQKQLVAIARALVLEPKILLMDEPLANLDVKIKRNILRLIRHLRDRFDLTVVYVTHDHREAFSVADKIAVMSPGKIEDYGTPQQIRASTNEYVRYFVEF